MHHFVQQNRPYLKRVHHAAHLYPQSAQLRRSSPYNSEAQGLQYKPGDNIR